MKGTAAIFLVQTAVGIWGQRWRNSRMRFPDDAACATSPGVNDFKAWSGVTVARVAFVAAVLALTPHPAIAMLANANPATDIHGFGIPVGPFLGYYIGTTPSKRNRLRGDCPIDIPLKTECHSGRISVCLRRK